MFETTSDFRPVARDSHLSICLNCPSLIYPRGGKADPNTPTKVLGSLLINLKKPDSVENQKPGRCVAVSM